MTNFESAQLAENQIVFFYFDSITHRFNRSQFCVRQIHLRIHISNKSAFPFFSFQDFCFLILQCGNTLALPLHWSPIFFATVPVNPPVFCPLPIFSITPLLLLLLLLPHPCLPLPLIHCQSPPLTIRYWFPYWPIGVAAFVFFCFADWSYEGLLLSGVWIFYHICWTSALFSLPCFFLFCHCYYSLSTWFCVCWSVCLVLF